MEGLHTIKKFIKQRYMQILAALTVNGLIFGFVEAIYKVIENKDYISAFFVNLVSYFNGKEFDLEILFNIVSENIVQSHNSFANILGTVLGVIYLFLALIKEKNIKKYIKGVISVSTSLLISVTPFSVIRDYSPNIIAMVLVIALPAIIVFIAIPAIIMTFELDLYNSIRDKEIFKVTNHRLTEDTKSKFDILGLLAFIFTNNGFTRTRAIKLNVLRNPKRDTIKIETAALKVFLGIAFACYVVRRVLLALELSQNNYFVREFDYIGFYSIGLAVFMLMPIPTLPGFNIAKAFFPSLRENQYVVKFINFKYRRWVLVLLAFLLNRNFIQLLLGNILYSLAFIFS